MERQRRRFTGAREVEAAESGFQLTLCRSSKGRKHVFINGASVTETLCIVIFYPRIMIQYCSLKGS